jgi:hypothetical protein
MARGNGIRRDVFSSSIVKPLGSIKSHDRRFGGLSETRYLMLEGALDVSAVVTSFYDLLI